MTELAKPEGNSRERPHEGRVHLFAIAEVDHKIPVSALDHLLNKLFETRAVLEGPATFYLYPDGAINAADLDGRCRVHTSGRNYPSPASAVKYLPALAPHKRLPECNDPPVDDEQDPPGGDATVFKVFVARGVELRLVTSLSPADNSAPQP